MEYVHLCDTSGVLPEESPAACSLYPDATDESLWRGENASANHSFRSGRSCRCVIFTEKETNTRSKNSELIAVNCPDSRDERVVNLFATSFTCAHTHIRVHANLPRFTWSGNCFHRCAVTAWDRGCQKAATAVWKQWMRVDSGLLQPQLLQLKERYCMLMTGGTKCGLSDSSGGPYVRQIKVPNRQIKRQRPQPWLRSDEGKKTASRFKASEWYVSRHPDFPSDRDHTTITPSGKVSGENGLQQ